MNLEFANHTETMAYFRHADGSVSAQARSGNGHEETLPPDDAVPITAQEYAAALALVEEGRAEHRAQHAAEEAARSLDDFTALTVLGLPEETARRLSGYQPPTEES